MTRRRRTAAMATTLATGLGLWVAAAVLPPSVAAAPANHHQPVRTTAVVQHGHAAFGNCPASAVRMTVTVPDPVVNPGTAVRVVALVRNLGAAPCHYWAPGPVVSHGPARPATMGPCGAMPLAVYRPAGHEVWPGPAAYSCPLLSTTALGPRAGITVSGQWDQLVVTPTGLEQSPAGPGTYRLVVDRRFRFTVRVR